MLENMQRIIEKMDTLNESFRGMVPKRARRQKPTFAAAMTEAKNAAPVKGIASTPAANMVESINSDVKTLAEKYAKEHGLKTELIMKIIEVASQNDPEAVGESGDLGLMQVKPHVFQEFGFTNPFDPEQNIMAGTKHLSNMLKRNGDNLPLALASYNSDPATVKRFGGVPPFPTTQNFVSQVLSGLGTTKNKD